MNIDKSIIEQCKNGDQEAFAVLVKRYTQDIYRLTLKIMCNNQEAEDMTQETFIKAWCNIARFNGKSEIGTWLYRIACNRCYDRLRELKEKTISLDTDNRTEIRQEDTAILNIETEMENKDLCSLISKYVSHLPPMQKICITLRDMEGMTVKEVMEITGLNLIQIKSNLYHARKHIKKMLEKEV